jgi:SAM-dependent methyltransferase
MSQLLGNNSEVNKDMDKGFVKNTNSQVNTEGLAEGIEGLAEGIVEGLAEGIEGLAEGIVEGLAKEFEKKYVKDVYDDIASHFDATRQIPWQEVKNFVLNIEPNSLVADVGAGTGKNMLIRSDCRFIGSDFSNEMVKTCVNKGLECVFGDITCLPFETDKFDYSLCVAVIHHLSTENGRRKSIEEIVRITKPKGKIFIQVWGHESANGSKKNGGCGTNIKKVNDVNINEGSFGDNDILIRWQLHKKYNSDESINKHILYDRYYHLFEKGELESLVDTSTCTIMSSFIDHNNYAVILQKL